MSRNKLLLFIVAILLLANVVLLYFLFKGESNSKSQPRERRGISEQLKNDVGFNEEQLKAYELRREKHMGEMKGLFEELRQTKEQFFTTVQNPQAADSIIQRGANTIAEKQKLIDLQAKAVVPLEDLKQNEYIGELAAENASCLAICWSAKSCEKQAKRTLNPVEILRKACRRA